MNIPSLSDTLDSLLQSFLDGLGEWLSDLIAEALKYFDWYCHLSETLQMTPFAAEDP